MIVRGNLHAGIYNIFYNSYWGQFSSFAVGFWYIDWVSNCHGTSSCNMGSNLIFTFNLALIT